MKCNIEELWESVNRIMLTDGGPFNAQDCGYVLPEALKQCAVVMVCDGRPDIWCDESYQRIFDEQNVIDALKELNQNGFLSFKEIGK